jgi:glycine dehydrogenase subunit 1
MSDEQPFIHPYIPNSVPEIKERMLREIGAGSVDELYADIPERLRFAGRMNLPEPLVSEAALKRHVEQILSRNRSCAESLSFLGGGCWPHYIPAVCDEINRRSEFLTAYAGEPYEDHGRFQALFEYESMMAELLDLDVVNVPTFDWCQAASTSVRMAGRITGRNQVLVCDTIGPDRLRVMQNYCRGVMSIVPVRHNGKTGGMDIDDLAVKCTDKTAAVYFENPSYLGFLEIQGERIAAIAHGRGGLCVVGVDPISLGVLAPPAHYGADIVCGDIQPLGVHMNFGGGQAGFIATRDEERFVMEYPSRLFGIAKTAVEGEWGFGDVAYDRTSFGVREKGKEFVGTAAALWGITAGVYLALMGPQGMEEIGRHILQKSQYAMKRIAAIQGVRAPRFESAHFKEFVVDFTATGKTVRGINEALLQRGIFGGRDLGDDFPELAGQALYCITELHTQADIDTLAGALTEVLR